MSDDLISRSALKKEFDDKCAYECAICKYAKDFAPCKLIDNAPTVPNEYMRGYEAAEREYKKPQGEWIFDSEFKAFGNPYGGYKCSCCCSHSSYECSFCKDCGADMRGGRE